MSKQKSHGKEKKKGSQLVIRVEKAERDAFVTLCDRLDTSAAREIRRFMRDLVRTHSGGAAADPGSDLPEPTVSPPAEAVTEEAAVVHDVVAAAEVAKPAKRQKRTGA